MYSVRTLDTCSRAITRRGHDKRILRDLPPRIGYNFALLYALCAVFDILSVLGGAIITT